MLGFVAASLDAQLRITIESSNEPDVVAWDSLTLGLLELVVRKLYRHRFCKEDMRLTKRQLNLLLSTML